MLPNQKLPMGTLTEGNSADFKSSFNFTEIQVFSVYYYFIVLVIKYQLPLDLNKDRLMVGAVMVSDGIKSETTRG